MGKSRLQVISRLQLLGVLTPRADKPELAWLQEQQSCGSVRCTPWVIAPGASPCWCGFTALGPELGRVKLAQVSLLKLPSCPVIAV